MSDTVNNELLHFWNCVAEDWNTQVGDEGDSNRRLNSDPVLWSMAGDVSGRSVLDAGCGTGYLTVKLAGAGASVIGVDFSPAMISIAKRRAPSLDFRVDSCLSLATVPDVSIDLLVSNYVLMDIQDLDACLKAFHRVLIPGGAAVAVFSHPCFPQSDAMVLKDEETITYTWPHSYFKETLRVDPPWGHFTSSFIRFHRPLSTYWRSFRESGFTVEDFQEPRVIPSRYHLADDSRKLNSSMKRPYSVAFRLEKKGNRE